MESNRRGNRDPFNGFYDIYYIHTVENIALYVYKTGLFSTDSLEPRFRDFMNSLLTHNPTFSKAVGILKAY